MSNVRFKQGTLERKGSKLHFERTKTGVTSQIAADQVQVDYRKRKKVMTVADTARKRFRSLMFMNLFLSAGVLVSQFAQGVFNWLTIGTVGLYAVANAYICEKGTKEKKEETRIDLSFRLPDGTRLEKTNLSEEEANEIKAILGMQI